MTKRAQLSVVSADRTAEVLEMRTRRMTFTAIGDELGITGERVRQIYSGALKARVSAAVDEHREALSDLADLAIAELVTLATNTAVSPRTRVECLSAARGWAAELGKLHGAYLDRRADVTVDAQMVPVDLHDRIARRVVELRAEAAS